MNLFTKKRFLILIIFFMVLNCSNNQAESKSKGKIVAKVNGKAIYENQVQKSLSQNAKMQKNLSPEKIETFKKANYEKALDLLIEKNIFLNAAKEKNITLGDTLVQKRIDMIKNQFPDENKFKEYMNFMNMTEQELNKNIKEQMLIQKFIKNLSSEIKEPTDQEASDYYKAYEKKFLDHEQIRASHILIKVDNQTDKQEKVAKKKKIEEIYKKLEAGAKFKDIAEQYSEGPSKQRGGDLGYFTRGRMVPPFEKAAFALKVGEISDIVETRFGYHIIKLTDRKKPDTAQIKNIMKRDYIMNWLEERKKNVEKFID